MNNLAAMIIIGFISCFGLILYFFSLNEGFIVHLFQQYKEFRCLKLQRDHELKLKQLELETLKLRQSNSPTTVVTEQVEE